ncbi:hypothetical protein C8Q72DRAFT_888556 [Fomitopsis betulina]|nr:hypothetical protein C8Q72DRAFT_888556 [Fomitopsis betulina]
MVLPVLLAIVSSAITSLGFLAMLLRNVDVNYMIYSEVASVQRLLERAEGLVRMLLEPPPPATLLLDPAPPVVQVSPDDPAWNWAQCYRSFATAASSLEYGDGFAVALTCVVLAIPLLALHYLWSSASPRVPPAPEDLPGSPGHGHDNFTSVVGDQTPFSATVLQQVDDIEKMHVQDQQPQGVIEPVDLDAMPESPGLDDDDVA